MHQTFMVDKVQYSCRSVQSTEGNGHVSDGRGQQGVYGVRGGRGLEMGGW